MKVKVTFSDIKCIDGWIHPQRILEMDCVPPVGCCMMFDIDNWANALTGTVSSIYWECGMYECFIDPEIDCSDATRDEMKQDLNGWTI